MIDHLRYTDAESCSCKRACRCWHKNEICIRLGDINEIDIPARYIDCDIDIPETSKIEIFCSDCPIVILTLEDVVEAQRCFGWKLVLNFCDLDALPLQGVTLHQFKCMTCKMTYRLWVDDKPYISGGLTLDPTFI